MKSKPSVNNGEKTIDLYEVLALSPDPVVVTDTAGGILFANEAAVVMLGAPAEKLFGRSFFSLMTEDESSCKRRLFEELLSDLSPRRCQGNQKKNHHECLLKPLFAENQSLQAVSFYFQGTEADPETLSRYNKLLDMIRRAQDDFITRTDHESVFNDILQLLIENSASSYGFLDEVLYTPEGKPFKLNLAMSNISWDKASQDLYEQLKNRQLEFHNLDNLAGYPVTEARPVFANDVPNHPAFRGLPPGHPALNTYLGIPLFNGTKVIGVIGLANRQGGYTESVVNLLEPLINTCEAMIRAEQISRKELEIQEKLRVNEEKFRRIVETTSEGIWMVDADQRTYYVNRRMAAMLGRSPEEMLSKPPESLVFPEDREAHRAEMAQRYRGRENRYERRFLHQDGHPVWGLVSATPILDERGVFRGSFALIADISELKSAEEKLRRSEDQFRRIFEVASVGIVQADPRKGRIVNCNDTYCRITGYSFEELLEIDFPELTHPDDRESDWLIFSRAAGGETPNYLNEKRYIRKDGSVIWVRLNAAFIRDQQGRPLKTVAVCEDISELKRKEELLRQLQKSESLARMAGAVAHKFNNHLAAVLGNLEMLLEDLPTDSDPYLRATEALQAGRQAAETSGMMMAYLGQKISKRDQLDLAFFCMEQTPLLAQDLPRSVKIETVFSGAPLPVQVDVGQFRQAIIQVLNNAVEAMAAGTGIIRITCARAFAAGIPESGRFPADWQPDRAAYACLAIADNGCGISSENMDKLFDPFFSSKFTGRGLGLPLLLGFVRSHGGVVTVESESGIGSVFRVYLPLTAEDSKLVEKENC